jgi:hypothetical protein
MSGLCNQYSSFLKDYETVAEIFTDNYLEVKYFDENNTESVDSVVSSMHLETKNTEIEDANLVAGWQPCVDPETVKKSGLIHTYRNNIRQNCLAQGFKSPFKRLVLNVLRS